MGESNFVFLQTNVGYGEPPSQAWQPIAACSLLVLVGVTGVGKSTTLDALRRAGLVFHLLPDRREMTDRLMIPGMQAMAGEAIGPVADRGRRFAYTRAYREQHPGGMGEALSKLFINTQQAPGLLLFDGLRGENEVVYAAQALPHARFVILDAPDMVRVVRLMGRQDPFDVIAARSSNATHEGLRFATLDVEGAETLFTLQEQHILVDLVSMGEVTADDLRRSLAIVVEERRNYDPSATCTSLKQYAPDRTLVVDTVADTPQTVAMKTIGLLRAK